MADGETPYRPMPADFAGPVCAECKYSRVGWTSGRAVLANDYFCDAYEPTVIRPAERCPITGEVSEPSFRYASCYEKNNKGQCDRFEAEPAGIVPIEQVVRRRPSRLRGLAARAGAWLVAWGETPL